MTEIQSIPGQVTGGTFTLQIGEFTSRPLPHNAGEAEVTAEANRLWDLQNQKLEREIRADNFKLLIYALLTIGILFLGLIVFLKLLS